MVKSTRRPGTLCLYGINSAQVLTDRAPQLVLTAFVSRERADDKKIKALKDKLDSLGISVQSAAKAKLDELTGGAVHQGIVLTIRPPQSWDENDLEDFLTAKAGENLLFLVLDGVTDPHNLGACLRSAWAFGVCAVIVPKDRSASLSGAALKTACGAAFEVPLCAVTNLARTLERLQEHNVTVAGLAGESSCELHKAPLSGSIALVAGSEGEGMRHLTRQKCDVIVRIPMQEGVESLNVSVAAAIGLYQCRINLDGMSKNQDA